MNLVTHVDVDDYLTSPLPEDTRAHDTRVADAENRLLQAQLEHSAATGAGASPARTSQTSLNLFLAEGALAAAKPPPRFVTNLCFSRHGTEKLAITTRGWTETEPEKGLTSDDAQKMYQCVCRAAGFDFLRLRFPYLLAVFRFFYYRAPVIWFGGAVLWVLTSASGVSTLASPSTPGAQKLVSAEGGIQGDGGATLLAIGPFHELLSRVQRAHPDIAMTGIADDTYSCGLLTPGADGTPAPLFAFADTKRRLCKSELNIDSNPSKCLVYSRSGDLSAAPADMPGSPNFVHADPETQLRGRKPVRAFKVAGALVGDDAECSRRLCEEITARLAPLEYLVSMRDHENFPNAQSVYRHTHRPPRRRVHPIPLDALHATQPSRRRRRPRRPRDRRRHHAHPRRR